MAPKYFEMPRASSSGGSLDAGVSFIGSSPSLGTRRISPAYAYSGRSRVLSTLSDIEVTAVRSFESGKAQVAFSKRELVQPATSDRETAGAVERTISQSTPLRAD